MRNLGETRNVGVDVQAHAGFGVPEPAGELDGLHPTLMPESGATVAEGVRAETGKAHSVTDFVPVHGTEWKAALERGDKEAWGIDEAADPLPFSALPWNSYAGDDFIEIRSREGERFAYASTQLLHDDDGELVARVDTFKNGHDLVFVGRRWFTRDYAWQLNPTIPSDVRDTGEIQHHAEITDEQTNGAGLVLGVEGADPFDYIAQANLVDCHCPECIDEYRRAETVTAPGCVSYVPPRGEPFSVYLPEIVSSDDGALEFDLWIFRGGKPIPYEVLTYDRLAPGSKGTAMLHLRIPAAAPVPDVEPAAVPGVPSPDVEGRQ